MALEIYWNENRNMLMIENIDSSITTRFDNWPAESYQRLDAAIADLRPKAYQDLCDEFGLGPQYAYARTFQFAACNFSTRDGHPDIDDDYNLITEKVECPIRHKCSRKYCTNESLLSYREKQVVRLFAQGSDEENIGEQLFISKATAHNHMTNIYKKLGFSGGSHPDRLLVSYAHHNRII